MLMYIQTFLQITIILCTLVASAFIIIQPELAFDVIQKSFLGNCVKNTIWGNIERKKEWSRLRLDGHLVLMPGWKSGCAFLFVPICLDDCWIEKSFYLKIRLSSKCRTWDTKLQPRKLQLKCSIPVWISWEVWSPSWSRKTRDLQFKQALDRITSLEAQVKHLHALFRARLSDDIDFRDEFEKMRVHTKQNKKAVHRHLRHF